MYLHRTHRVTSCAKVPRPKLTVLLLAVVIVVGADAASTLYDLAKPGLKESGPLVSQFASDLRSGHYWYVAFLPEFGALAAVTFGSFVLVRLLGLNQNLTYVSLAIPALIVLNNIRLGLLS